MTILLPVGHDLGEIHGADSTHGADPEASHVHHVRIGGEVIGLNLEEYGLWCAVREVEDGGNQSPSTLGALVRFHGAKDHRATLRDLTEAGLVVSVLPVGAAAKRFTNAHRLLPLGYALGNSAEDRESYRIHLGGEEALAISWLMYYLWSLSPTHDSLAEGISLAIAAQRERVGSAEAMGEDQITAAVLTALPTLLFRRCAYLDTA